MKRVVLYSFLGMLVLQSCGEATKKGKEEKDKKDSTQNEAGATQEKEPVKLDSAAQMKAWMDFMTPGEMHSLMASMDGKWKEDITMWMEPGTPPQKSTATAENKMILGGLYQESVSLGNFDGMPFEGHSLMGYDNVKKVFVNTWVDNFGSGIMILEGPYDAATKTIKLKGTCTDPMTQGVSQVRQDLILVDEKTHKLEMFMTVDGKEFKNMEITFTKM